MAVPKADADASDFPGRNTVTVGDENQQTGTQVIDEDAGTIYVVSVSGCLLYTSPSPRDS